MSRLIRDLTNDVAGPYWINQLGNARCPHQLSPHTRGAWIIRGAVLQTETSCTGEFDDDQSVETVLVEINTRTLRCAITIDSVDIYNLELFELVFPRAKRHECQSVGGLWSLSFRIRLWSVPTESVRELQCNLCPSGMAQVIAQSRTQHSLSG